MRTVREAIRAFRRAPLLSGLSVTAIGFSLFILGLFGVTAHNIDLAIAEVERQVEVVAYLREDAGTTRAEAAVEEVSGYPEVASVRYISKTEALHNASRDLPEFSEAFSDLEVNPLPASLEVRLEEGFRSPEHVESVAARLRGYGFVEDVRFGSEWVERIHALRRVAGASAGILGGAFALVAVMLVGTAIRMGILARSEEISIMQTVGASEGYIRRPYLLEGLVTGLGGGLLALGLTYGAYRFVEGRFLALAWIPDVWSVLGIAAAALLGMLAAGRSVRRELRGLYEM